MKTNVESTIYAIFERILRVSPEKLTEETRRAHLDAWDSLSHMLIVAALIEDFQVKIPPEQALEMESIQDIKRIITNLIRIG